LRNSGFTSDHMLAGVNQQFASYWHKDINNTGNARHANRRTSLNKFSFGQAANQLTRGFAAKLDKHDFAVICIANTDFTAFI
jgi:hypothetical protein